jgi:hypothetical protein
MREEAAGMRGPGAGMREPGRNEGTIGRRNEGTIILLSFSGFGIV